MYNTRKDKHALPTVKHIIIMVVHLMGIVSVCVTSYTDTHTHTDTYERSHCVRHVVKRFSFSYDLIHFVIGL